MRVGSPGTVYLVLATLEITDAPDVGLQIRPMTAAVARIAPAADSDQIARQQSTPVIFGHQVHHSKPAGLAAGRSEEHTSELQSLMRISYAVFCLKKKKNKNTNKIQSTQT